MIDLGAFLNVMPYSIYASLKLGPLNKIGVVIQLVDRSNAYLKGEVEDVLTDFYVLDMENGDQTAPILLGGPFLKTSKIKIDVHVAHLPSQAIFELNGKDGLEVSITKHLEKENEELALTPIPDLKPFLSYLKYVFLRDEGTLPMIISSKLSAPQEKKTCAEGAKLSRQPQRRLNPSMIDVVKKEILKLLEVGVIYLISDSNWVSSVHVVPKNTGITVVKNQNDELVPTHVQNGWRVISKLQLLQRIKKRRLLHAHSELLHIVTCLLAFAMPNHFPKETFLDEQLFSASVTLPWYANTVNYLVTNMLSPGLSKAERDTIKSDAKYYVWMTHTYGSIVQIE
ncbi:hypothetical protein CK203_061688 [Vitis vinifera]|uniref:Uncharacterized protein n=1 Tax=Vitis vinifera TaxID=29760 RepID=A0A438G841_VITVI|nr:hypothetical protein CK203_061688 [Vitis vinifera]